MEANDVNGHLKTEIRKLRNRIKNINYPFIPDAIRLQEIISSCGYEPDDMNPKIFDVIHCAMLRARENMIDDITAKQYLLLLQTANKASERNYFTKKQKLTLEKWTKTIEDRCSKIINNEPLVSDDEIHKEEQLHDPNGPRRLRMAEAVLDRRTNQVALVLERCFNDLNQQAVLRTAECLGIQYIYVVQNTTCKRKKIAKKLTKGNDSWLTIKKYKTTSECIKGLRNDGREIWATDLSIDSISLESDNIIIPDKVAIVVGNETEGVTVEMLQAADKRIFLPIHGFSESLNLSVASALVLQKILSLCPYARGNLTNEEKITIREEWYKKLANNDKQEALFTKYLDNPPKPLDDLRRCENFENNKSWIDKSLKRSRDKKPQEEKDEQIKKKQRINPPLE